MGPFINNVRTRGEGRGLTYLVKFIKERRGEGVKKCPVRANVIYEWPLGRNTHFFTSILDCEKPTEYRWGSDQTWCPSRKRPRNWAKTSDGRTGKKASQPRPRPSLEKSKLKRVQVMIKRLVATKSQCLSNLPRAKSGDQGVKFVLFFLQMICVFCYYVVALRILLCTLMPPVK